MKTKLPTSITSVADAQHLLTELYNNSESYHPEDDANDLVGEPFTKMEGDKLNELMQQIYQLPEVPEHFDPCDYLLKLIEAEMVWVITHGLLFAKSRHYSIDDFYWSSNLSEAWQLSEADIAWFNKNKKKYPCYELEKVSIKPCDIKKR